MTQPLSPAARRSQEMLASVLTQSKEFRAGVVVLSYRRPGASEQEVSFGHSIGLSSEEGARDFVLLAQTLRRIADQLDQLVQHPEEFLQRATIVGADGKKKA